MFGGYDIYVPFFANAVNNYVAQRLIHLTRLIKKASDKKLKELIAANKKKTEENQQLGISQLKIFLVHL